MVKCKNGKWMFASLSAHSPIGIHSLVNHGKTVFYTINCLLLWYSNAPQAGTSRNPRWKSTCPSTAIKENNRRQTGKVHFCDQKCTLPAFTCRKRHFENPIWAQIGPILGAFIRIMGPNNPTNAMPKCVKITPKWGLGAFWTIWGPFLSLLYRFPKE